MEKLFHTKHFTPNILEPTPAAYTDRAISDSGNVLPRRILLTFFIVIRHTGPSVYTFQLDYKCIFQRQIYTTVYSIRVSF